MSLLDEIRYPADLRRLKKSQLLDVVNAARERHIDVVSQKGGHFGASLGVVELTVALHYAFDTPTDQIVWDTGHQAYIHKILTGRNEALPTIRELSATGAKVVLVSHCGRPKGEVNPAMSLRHI